MDIEKVLSGLIGGAVSGGIALGAALVAKGKREERFDRLGKDVESAKADLYDLKKTTDTKVSLDRFEKEISEIHGRMSRTQREQAAAIEKLDNKVDGLAGEIKFMSGVMSQIPAKLDSIAERLAKVDQ